MALLAVEYLAGLSSTTVTSYDSSKWNLGGNLVKRADSTPVFIGPPVIGLARPVEQGVLAPGIFPQVVRWSPTLDWVFLMDNAAGAVTRRIILYTYNRTNSAFTQIGYVTTTPPMIGTVTARTFRMSYERYNVGTARTTTGSPTVGGVSTTWTASRIPAGCRIGFGDTIPSNIAAWYEISAINGDTSITLTGNIAAGQVAGKYVIEDLRAYYTTINSTTASNSSLQITKGLSYGIFTGGGTTVAAATTTDNLRRTYATVVPKAAATVTTATGKGDTLSQGLELDQKESWIIQNAYTVSGGTTSLKLFKYNVRKALTPGGAGGDSTCYVTSTTSLTVSGSISTTGNNLILATAQHGPAKNKKALYFLTASKIYCCLVKNVDYGSVGWLSYTMNETPPGTTTTFPASGLMAQIAYSPKIDRFIISATSSTASGRMYVTQFRTDLVPFETIFTVDTKQLDQSTVSNLTTPHPNSYGISKTIWETGGTLFIAGVGTTAVTNILYSVPIGCDWAYTGLSVNTDPCILISPKFLTPNCNSYKKLFATEAFMLGGSILGMAVEPHRYYYRTQGIDNNAGSWTLLTEDNDIRNIPGATAIQFKVEFRTIGTYCVPSRIYGLGVTYNDNSVDTHYQPSVNLSSITNKQFAWRFSTLFGGAVPTLKIRILDVPSGNLLCEDTTVAPTGTWEKSTTNGVTWGSYNTTDKSGDSTYIRYTPAALVGGRKVKAILTLA